jgi:N-acetylneuraminic acid mutarotase
MNSYREDRMNESVRESLDSLPESYREVLILYYFGGMNSNDIARALGTSPSAILQRLCRARTQLKEDMLGMMGATFESKKLRSSFTFRIVEAVKRINTNPVSLTKGLPWGISLATGVIIAVLSIGTHINPINTIGAMSGSPLSSESKVLKVGEIPVDILKVSNISVLSNQQWKGTGLGSVLPNLQNALFMAPQAEGGTWTKRADMPTARQQLSVCAANGKIYAIGGWDGKDNIYFSTVEEYDPIADRWERKSDKPTPEAAFDSWVMDNRIYTLNTFKGEIEQYEPEIDRWTKWRNTDEVGLYAHSASLVNGKVYVIGGYKINGAQQIHLSTVYEYDTVADKWAKKADMPTPRSMLSTCACNGKIYAIGGWNGNTVLSNVEEYDPIAGKWTKKASMSAIRHSLVTCAVKGKIYAIGGIGMGGPGPSLVEEYDPITDTWTRKADTPTGRWFSSGCVVNGKIYVIGGTNVIGIVTPPLSTLEVYDPGTGESVNFKGKLPTTWGDIRTALNR